MRNVGDNAVGSADVEGPTATHRDFADIGSLLGPTCDNGSHEVACLEPLYPLVLLGAGTRKSVLVHAAHLP